MKRILSFLALTLLAGCSSTSVSQQQNIPIQQLSGGQVEGDATSFYWLNRRQGRPMQLAEIVTMGEYGQFQSDFRWQEEELREVMREGNLLDGEELKPFTLHVRYDTKGVPVYQRYSLGGTVLPLTDTELYQLRQQAENAVALLAEQNKRDWQLVQGVWSEQRLTTCVGARVLEVKLPRSLPQEISQRLEASAGTGKQHYLAVVGKRDSKTLTAAEVLMLSNNSLGCLEPPRLLEE